MGFYIYDNPQNCIPILFLISFKQMEDLSKHQLILLVLLITFITSIGTSIISFTLLQEAPVEVTQNINRVVEKTVERVVTEPGEKEKVIETVVVTEEDRVLDTISKNENSIVRLLTLGADGGEVVSGLGLVVTENGVVVADIRSYTATQSYSLRFNDGQVLPTGDIEVDSVNGLVFIKARVPADIGSYSFDPAVLGNSDTLKIGQTLVAISGKDSNSASIGRIKQINFGADQTSVSLIVSDMPVSRASQGSPALNLSGEVVGMEALVSSGDSTYSYVPVNKIKSALSVVLPEFLE